MGFVIPRKVSMVEKAEMLESYGAKLAPQYNDIFYRGYTREMAPAAVHIHNSLLRGALKSQTHFAEILPYLPKINGIFGLAPSGSIASYEDAYNLHDLLHCYHAHGLPFPPGFEDGKCYEALKFTEYFLSYSLRFVSPVLRRLANHWIYKDLILALTQGHTAEPTFHYYSTHDRNIFGHILGLGCDIGEMPPFSTGLTIESYESAAGAGLIRLDYNDKCITSKVFGTSEEYVRTDELIARLKKETFDSDAEFMQLAGVKDEVMKSRRKGKVAANKI